MDMNTLFLSKLIQFKETSSNTIHFTFTLQKFESRILCIHPVPLLLKETNCAPSFHDPYWLSDELDKRTTKIEEMRCARSRNTGRIIWHDWAS